MADQQGPSAEQFDDLKDALKEVSQELRLYRNEAAKTFVRQDTHSRDVQLLTESHNKDIALITQMLTTMKESLEKSIGDDGLGGKVKKIENDNDWLQKLVYGTLVVAILAGLGITGLTTTGVIR
jgi:hypothetical protein